jgi:hypothetical protein
MSLAIPTQTNLSTPSLWTPSALVACPVGTRQLMMPRTRHLLFRPTPAQILLHADSKQHQRPSANARHSPSHRTCPAVGACSRSCSCHQQVEAAATNKSKSIADNSRFKTRTPRSAGRVPRLSNRQDSNPSQRNSPCQATCPADGAAGRRGRR